MITEKTIFEKKEINREGGVINITVAPNDNF